MKLKAIHAIYTADKKKKQVRVEPGTEFDTKDYSLDDAAAEKLVSTGAALLVAEDKPAAKKPAAKKAPAKDAVTPAAVTGKEGATGDDGEDLLG